MQLSESKLLEIRKEAEDTFPSHVLPVTDDDAAYNMFQEGCQNGYIAGATAEAIKSLTPATDKMSFKEMLEGLFDLSFMSEKERQTIFDTGEMYAKGCVRQVEGERDKAIELLKKYEQWEADLISDNAHWWPYQDEDTVRGSTWSKMMELQAERNEILHPDKK